VINYRDAQNRPFVSLMKSRIRAADADLDDVTCLISHSTRDAVTNRDFPRYDRSAVHGTYGLFIWSPNWALGVDGCIGRFSGL
jgi:hypothetical protein